MITIINTDYVGYRLILLLFYFGFTRGITVGVIIIIHARFIFIKTLIDYY